MLTNLRNKLFEFVVVVILFGGLFYASTTAWKNEEKLTSIGDDVKSIKKSMISLLLDENPNKTTIAIDLLSNAKFIKGIKNFKAGKYEGAFFEWGAAAMEGDRDSLYAIAVANETLRNRLEEMKLSKEEKNKIKVTLNNAPKINEKNGVYYLVK